jgi:Spy/CpxP family protein refolding chaperone
MSARTVLGLTAALLLTAAAPARADGPVPQAFRSLKPYQVVEQIMGQRELLSLTDEQFARLDDLSIAIRNEKHSFIHRGGKPHFTQHVPMVTQQQAYEKALAVLTPDQQARLEALFQAPALTRTERAPRQLTVPHGKP